MSEPKMKLKVNKIRCKLCGDVIESTYRHDFVECSCGACYTDGGTDYLRIGWEPEKGEYDDIVENLSEWVPAE